MRKEQNLKSFNLYQYLKEMERHSLSLPYFLANDDTYRNANVGFPFRTFSYGIGITYTGEPGTVKIGSADYELKPGSITTIGPGIVSLWTPCREAKHETIYFTEALFTDVLKGSFLHALPFFLPGGQHVIHVSEEKTEQIKTLFSTIHAFRNNEKVMPGLVYSLLMTVQECHQNTPLQAKSATQQEVIVSNFRKLLTQSVLEQKDVNYYAGQLNITPKYLSEILLKQTGKAAKKWIEEHISLEAKSLLRQTEMSVQEICYWLGYEDTSYFTKAFKKWEGITPLAYRSL